MQEAKRYPEQDPRFHTERIKAMLMEVAAHARDDEAVVTDPKALALFETTAEVLSGLATAYDHYEQRSEKAWR